MTAKLTAQFVESAKAPAAGQIDYWDAHTRDSDCESRKAAVRRGPSFIVSRDGCGGSRSEHTRFYRLRTRGNWR